MCQTEIFTEAGPTGQTHSYARSKLCKDSRNGRVCKNESTFEHPVAYLEPRKVPGAAPVARLGMALVRRQPRCAAQCHALPCA